MKIMFYKVCISVSLLVMGIAGAPIIGQSSMITLNFPWGARSTGLGETFTGIADDEQALFYNPAGLGQPPLSKTWIYYQPEISQDQQFIAIAGGAKNQKDVWVLNSDSKLIRWNGNSWVDFSVYAIDSTTTFQSIVEEYLPIENRDQLDSAILSIKIFNDLYPKERKKIADILSGHFEQLSADSLASFFAYLPAIDHSRTTITAYLLEHFDTEEASSLADAIVPVLDDITGLSGIYDIKIPYQLGIWGIIHNIAVDENGRLWLAGDKGLWRFDSEWKKFTSSDGVPNDGFLAIEALSGGDVAIGTDSGAYLFEAGNFKRINGQHAAFNSKIKSIAVAEDAVYLGTSSGLLSIVNGIETMIDTSKGLLNDNVTALMVDGRNRLWVGGNGGVSLFNGLDWKRFRFKGSNVLDFVAEKDSKIWIATDKGAVEYIENRDGKPEWKVHHEKNNLKSSVANALTFHRNDIWIATDNGISQFRHGEVRATLFYEKLLPNLHINDMWHATAAGIIPLNEWGTFGVFFNQLFFGEIPDFNPDGTMGNSSSAFEIVGGLSYGMRIQQDFSVGLTLKYAFSRLKEDDAEAQTFAIDAGILKRDFITKDLTLGFSLLNMGPPVWYAEEDDKNAIPFTLRLGTSYKPISTSTHYLLLALDLEREIVYVDTENGQPEPFFVAFWKDLFADDRESARDELKKVIIHAGLEFNYLDFISPRIGWMYDHAGTRNEMNIGLGIRANMILADFSIILTMGGNDVRQNQVRFSVTYAR